MEYMNLSWVRDFAGHALLPPHRYGKAHDYMKPMRLLLSSLLLHFVLTYRWITSISLALLMLRLVAGYCKWKIELFEK
jgi:hypothetical protein